MNHCELCSPKPLAYKLWEADHCWRLWICSRHLNEWTFFRKLKVWCGLRGHFQNVEPLAIAQYICTDKLRYCKQIDTHWNDLLIIKFEAHSMQLLQRLCVLSTAGTHSLIPCLPKDKYRYEHTMKKVTKLSSVIFV